MSGILEERRYQVTCDPGGDVDNPIITDLLMPVRVVRRIRVRVPPGPLSSMGFAIAVNGVPVIPYQSNVFVVADDEQFEWVPTGQITSGAWQVAMYNNGNYPHTIYLDFTTELPDAPKTTTAATFLPVAAITPPPPPVTVPVTPGAPPLSLPS